MCAQLVVGISDCKVSDDPKSTILTYALGSCVGISLYDANTRIGGLLHVLLPRSRSNRDQTENPFMFADSGITAMVDQMVCLGADTSRINAKLAGGANMLTTSVLLDVGKRNAETAIETLQLLNIPVISTALGGTLGRSMSIDLANGRTWVRVLGLGEEEL
jgi:chemotaxis protein CheD